MKKISDEKYIALLEKVVLCVEFSLEKMAESENESKIKIKHSNRYNYSNIGAFDRDEAQHGSCINCIVF